MVNKNEKEQFELFKELLNKYSKHNKNDLFYGFKKVEQKIGNQSGCDAIVYTKDDKKINIKTLIKCN